MQSGTEYVNINILKNILQQRREKPFTIKENKLAVNKNKVINGK